MEANELNYEMTRIGANGNDVPLPKRQPVRTLVPLSWLGREVAISYTNAHGHGSEARANLIDFCPMGLILIIDGSRTIIAHEAIRVLELTEA